MFSSGSMLWQRQRRPVIPLAQDPIRLLPWCLLMRENTHAGVPVRDSVALLTW